MLAWTVIAVATAAAESQDDDDDDGFWIDEMLIDNHCLRSSTRLTAVHVDLFRDSFQLCMSIAHSVNSVSSRSFSRLLAASAADRIITTSAFYPDSTAAIAYTLHQ